MSLGLYIHIPFCERKCAYCDFLSFKADEDLQKKYVNSLINEIKTANRCKNEVVDSVFIGGGTPSCIKEEYIAKICNAVYERFNVSKLCEITIEINPASENKRKLDFYKKSGINRVSIGVQSFNDGELKCLGRLHNCDTAKKCISEVFGVGFENVNLDLMFAIPNQSEENFENNILTALEFPVTHISAYSLIIEENTEFYKMYEEGMICETEEDVYCKMYDSAEYILNNHGFSKYEISNFAKEGFQCRHNLKYWNCDNYMGFGIGAVGFLNGVRYENTRNIKSYIECKVERQNQTLLTQKELESEYIMCALRKTDGINICDFKQRFGYEFFDIHDISKYENGGFMARENNRVFFTNKGMKVSNSILCDLI